METQTDTAEIQDRKKLFALLLTEKRYPEKNVLDIMPDIIKVSGDKAGRKVLNKFLDTDYRKGYVESNKLLSKGWTPNRLTSVKQAFRFRLVMPKNKPFGLNPLQEYALQENYLKNVKVGGQILDIKDIKLIVAESGKKIIHLAKNLTIDFRRAGNMSNEQLTQKMLNVSLNH